MKTAEGFSLYQIQDSYYLLPYGQNITLFRGGIQLNETGLLLWKAIESGMSEPELFQYLVDHYQATEAEYSDLQKDIEQFLRQLQDAHLIQNDIEPSGCTISMQIGGLVIGYQGPEDLLHPNLQSFLCARDNPEQYWKVLFTPPEPVFKAERIIKTRELEILVSSKAYIIIPADSSLIPQITVSLDGTMACFYCKAPYDSKTLMDQLFHAFRYPYLIYAQRMGVFALHSASILYNNKVWLFSASSGTGKSTQADYWNKLYQTPIINGDLNLIHFLRDEPIVSGLPWCGTSEIYSVESFPLGGIVLLKQGATNTIQPLPRDKQQLSVAARLISPTWTAKLLDYNLSFTGKLIEKVPVLRFICRKEPEAAEQLHQYIDELLSKG